MHLGTRTWIRGAMLVGCVAMLALAASLTLGAEGRPGGKVRGCVAKDGDLRLVKRCAKGERRVRWNVRGPRGPVGPAGARGPVGPIGPQGKPGADGANGEPGQFSVDSFEGMSCERNSATHSVDVSYDSQGFATFTC